MKNSLARRGLLISSTVVILILVFGAGFVAGRWSMRPTERTLTNQVVPGGHGAVGTIQSIEDKMLTLQSRDGLVQVRVDAKTRIESAPKRKKIELTDLKIGDRVVVIGSPNEQGQIIANLISTLAPLNPLTPTRGANESK